MNDHIYKINSKLPVLAGITILLVEPHYESAAVYKRQLEENLIKVLSCATVEEMLSQTAAGGIDLVIFNPGENASLGVKHVRKLRSINQQVPIITITSTIHEDHIDAMMMAGVSAHINRKLSEPKDVLLAISQLVAPGKIN